MIYEVVYCSECKKPIKSVPAWLAGVNVRFSCESCRQKHPRGVLGFDSAPGPRMAGGAAEADGDEILAEPGELVEEEPLEDVDAEAGDEILAGAVEE